MKRFCFLVLFVSLLIIVTYVAFGASLSDNPQNLVQAEQKIKNVIWQFPHSI